MEHPAFSRAEALAALGPAAPHYLALERALTADPAVVCVYTGETLRSAIFRFHLGRRFLAYCRVYEGYFDLMTRFPAPSLAALDAAVPGMSAAAQACWARRYPCGEGAWIHYHVSDEAGLREARIFLDEKIHSLMGKKEHA